MRTINFFAPYDQKKQVTLKQVLGLFCFLALAAMGGFYWYNMNTIAEYDAQIAAREEQLNKPEMQEMKEEMTEAERKYAVMKAYHQSMEDICTLINDAPRVQAELLRIISEGTPRKIAFKNLSIMTEEFILSGVASEREQVAELLHNMKTGGLFHDIYVNNILGQEEGGYLFTIAGTFN